MLYSSSAWLMFEFVIYLLLESVSCENALIFNRKGKDGVLVGAIYSETNPKCEFCTAACAIQPHEKIIADFDISISGNSLYVKSVPENDDDFNQIMSPKFCSFPYQPSIVFDASLMRFELGYEVYYEKDRFGDLFESAEYSEYESVVKGIERMKAKSTEEPLPPPNAHPKKDLVSGNGKSLGFIWITVFSIDFDVNLINPKTIEYQSSYNTQLQITEICKNYELGKELYNDIVMEELYSEKSQTKMFSYKSLSPSPSSNQKNSTPPKCGQPYGCLVKTSLIPDYYLGSDSALRASCSNMITVPIWETIVKGSLKKVDQYLYIISQLWKGKIHIYSGTYGILKLPSYYLRIPKETYLDYTNGIIPVPEIIYKVVRYEMEMGEEYVEQFHAVIVIHNNPTSSPVKRLCSKEKEISGWKAIENSKRISGRTYVCPMDLSIYEKLNSYSPDPEGFDLPSLELDEFPIFYDETEDKIYVQDKTEFVDDNWKKFFVESTAQE